MRLFLCIMLLLNIYYVKGSTKIVKYGPIIFEVQLLYLDLTFHNCNPKKTQSKCSLAMYSRLCSEDNLDPKNKLKFKDLHRDLNVTGYKKWKTTKKTKQYQCTDIKFTEFDKNTNFIYCNRTKCKYNDLAKNTNSKYTDKVMFSFYLTNLVSNKPIPITDSPIIFEPNVSFHKIKLYIDPKYDLKMKIRLQSVCRYSYHGQTCFHKCEDSVRIKCHCTKKSQFTFKPCHSKCLNGFLPTEVVHVIKDFPHTIIQCIFLDYCKIGTTNKCRSACITYANNTGCCSDVQLNVKVQDEIFTKKVFFDDEILVITPVIDSKCPKMYERYNIFITQIKPMYSIESQSNLRDLSVRFRYGKKKIESKINITLDKYQMNRKSFDKEFYIYKRINTLFIQQSSSNSIVKYKVIKGETLTCNFSGKPQYQILSFIDSKSLGISFKIDGKLIIADSLKSRNGIILCRATLLMYGRKPISYLKKTKILITHYSVFKWIPEDNLLFNNSISCILSTLTTKYKLKIIQVLGDVDLKISNNKVYLDKMTSGLYQFKCFFDYNNTQIINSRTKRFAMRKYPYKICFYPNPFINGAIIQCVHDGLLNDDYYSKIKIVFENGTFMERRHYIRIPYEYDLKKLQRTCTIHSVIDSKVVLKKKDDITLIKETESMYTTSADDVACGFTVLRAEYVSYKQEMKNSYRFFHSYFFAKFNDFNNPVKLFPLIYLILIGLYVYICIQVADHKNNSSQGHISGLLKGMKMRKIQDKLVDEAGKHLFNNARRHSALTMDTNLHVYKL